MVPPSSLYQCSAAGGAGGAHPGRRSLAQCRTKPRCPSLLCRPRRVTSSGKVQGCVTSPGEGIRARSGERGALRVDTPRRTRTAGGEHLR